MKAEAARATRERARSWRAALLPTLLLVGSGVLLFPSAGRDDAHISYWPAYTLAQFGEIVNYNGDRVEQSSSLAHVLLLAAVHAVSGVEIATLGRILSVLCGVATLFAVWCLGERLQRGAGFAASLLVATFASFAYWSFGGLESSLASLAVVLLLLAWSGDLQRPSAAALCIVTVATAFAVAVRPEMPVVLACALVGAFLADALHRRALGERRGAGDPSSAREWLKLAAVVVTCSAALMAARWAYFDSLVPQPVLAKAGRISVGASGLAYLASALLAGPVAAVVTFVWLAAIGERAWRQLQGPDRALPTTLSLSFLGTYLCFIVLVGGDWMEGGRMLVPILPIGAALVAAALSDARVLASPRVRVAALAGLLGLQLAGSLELAASRSVGMPLWTSLEQVRRFGLEYGAQRFSFFDRANRDHLRNIPTLKHVDDIVRQLLEGDREVVHILAHQMGFLPYYLQREQFGRVRFFDANGLTDRVATHARAFAGMPRTIYGIVGTMNYCIDHPDRVAVDPEIPHPDLIVYQFYQQGPTRPWFERGGYRVVYVQRGPVPTGSRHFPGHPVYANQLIAVRKDLLPELRRLPRPFLDFAATNTMSAGERW